MSRPFPLSLLFVACVILTGCDRCSKGKDDDAKTSASQAAAGGQTGSSTNVGAGSADQGGTLQVTDVKPGTGSEAINGKKVSVYYTGTLLDGTKFDGTKDKGTPFKFTLGTGMVISGWDQGVKGMKEGGVRKLVIPPNLAYGNHAVGGVIPPNSTLVFEIELLKVE